MNKSCITSAQSCTASSLILSCHLLSPTLWFSWFLPWAYDGAVTPGHIWCSLISGRWRCGHVHLVIQRPAQETKTRSQWWWQRWLKQHQQFMWHIRLNLSFSCRIWTISSFFLFHSQVTVSLSPSTHTVSHAVELTMQWQEYLTYINNNIYLFIYLLIFNRSHTV